MIRFKFSLNSLLLFCLLLMSAMAARAQNLPLPPQVRGDGIADDTAALQRTLDALGKTGGELRLPPGKYLLRGTLNIPTGVSLQGSWDAPHHGAWNVGSTLLMENGRGQEDGPATITLQPSSALRGFTMLWPEQVWPNIVPYPYAIHGVGMHNTIENVTFVNAYQGIKIGQPFSELHLIRNVFGCVLRVGVFIDSTSDIGRLENVHFNPHYWPRSGHASAKAAGDMEIARYMADHLEAFVFGRSDWQYVTNCFVFAAKIGYHFIKTPDGSCNAQLLNIGGDYCRVGLQIDDIQAIGLQVTNGAFTSFSGEPNVGVMTSESAQTGAAQFVNCNFWATPGGAARLNGKVNVAFNDCHFLDVPDFDAPHAAIEASNGRLNLRGNTFGKSGRAVNVKNGVTSAIVMANTQPGGLQIDNAIGARLQSGFNEQMVRPESVNYRLKIGTTGDEAFARGGWYGGENNADSPLDSRFHSARWTNGKATLRLPVEANRAYKMRIALSLRAGQPAQTIEANGATISSDKVGFQILELNVPATARDYVDVTIEGAPWKPSELLKTDDKRDLGAFVAGLEMIGQPTAEIEDLN